MIRSKPATQDYRNNYDKIFKGGQDAKRNNRTKNNNATEVQSKDTNHESGILRQNRDDA